MSMSTITCTNPPTRSSIYRMFNEAWGWFCGNLSSTNIQGIHENQIKFDPAGHSHNTASTESGGYPITSTAIEKRHFDLNDCKIGWMDYFGRGDGSDTYAIFAGQGQCVVSATTVYTSVMYGSTYIDYNPYATTPETTYCQLDMRGQGYTTETGDPVIITDSRWYDPTSPNNTNWTILGAWALPNKDRSATYGDQVYNYQWGTDTTGPYFRFDCNQANTTATGTLSFDYMVVCKRL